MQNFLSLKPSILFASVLFLVVYLTSDFILAAEDSLQNQTESTTSSKNVPKIYMGREIARTMSFHGANWLIRESREQEENPQKLIDALKIIEGQSICDFGCGNGYYALRLAQLVGNEGRVYGVDIQQEMLDMLEQRCQARGVTNVVPILAGIASPNLGDAELDLVLMVDVYHELSYPEEILTAIYKKLKPTGRIVLVEYREEDPEVPIRPRHKMSQAQAMKELVANRYKLVGQYDSLPWQHVLFFARQDSPLPNVQLKPWQSAKSGKSVP